MREIPLSQGKIALVDDEDFEWLTQWKWSAVKSGKTWYAIRTGYKPKRTIRMHREIMMTEDHMIVDHKNGNGLDNRKKNLRECTPRENSMNKGVSKSNLYGLKGVTYKKNMRNHYCAQIQIDRKNRVIGYFETIEEAAMAYDREAMRLYGEFARTNFSYAA